MLMWIDGTTQKKVWSKGKRIVQLEKAKESKSYGVVFLPGPPDFQYQKEKTCSANEELFYSENFVKN